MPRKTLPPDEEDDLCSIVSDGSDLGVGPTEAEYDHLTREGSGLNDSEDGRLYVLMTRGETDDDISFETVLPVTIISSDILETSSILPPQDDLQPMKGLPPMGSYPTPPISDISSASPVLPADKDEGPRVSVSVEISHESGKSSPGDLYTTKRKRTKTVSQTEQPTPPSSTSSSSSTTSTRQTSGATRKTKVTRVTKVTKTIKRRKVMAKPSKHSIINDKISSPQPYPHDIALLHPQGLPPISVQINDKPLYLFFRFAAERQRMYERREAGIPRDQISKDETMRGMVVGNVFRELDAGSERMKGEIVGQGDQSLEEVCFRIFLFCGFYEHATWVALKTGLGYIPRWSTFKADLPKYERILHHRAFTDHQTIYTSVFQLVPPTKYFGLGSLPHYAATLRFVLLLMDSNLPIQLSQCKYAVDASKVLQTFPTLGAFLSLNLISFLNDTPHFQFKYRNYASCGPGAKAYLKRIFGEEINSIPRKEAALTWLQNNQWKYWNILSISPPYAYQVPGIKPGLRALDFENAMCWCTRYVKKYSVNGWRSLADLPLPNEKDRRRGEEEGEWVGEPRWCIEEKHLGSVSRGTVIGDYDEQAEKLPPQADGGEGSEGSEGQGTGGDVYEVEKIIERTRGVKGEDTAVFRVRWKGYPPEDDTWEKGRSLKEGASEALQDWLDWEKNVQDTLQTIRETYKWTCPDPIEPMRGNRKGIRNTSSAGDEGMKEIDDSQQGEDEGESQGEDERERLDEDEEDGREGDEEEEEEEVWSGDIVYMRKKKKDKTDKKNERIRTIRTKNGTTRH